MNTSISEKAIEAIKESYTYLKNPAGTIVRESNPEEAKRLQDKANFEEISAQEGQEAFDKIENQ